MSDRPRFELSTVQVIASAGAAVTGAVLTSYLGDGGTILGTAVGSIASTTGFAVYKHYLGRTKEVVAPVIVERARVWTPGTGSTTTVRQTARPQQQETRQFGLWDPRERTGRQDAGPFGTVPGATAPAAGSSGATGPWKPAARAGGDDATQTFGTVRVGDTVYGDPSGNGGNGAGRNGGPGGPAHAAGAGGNGEHAAGGLAGLLRERPRWLVTAASAAAVFVVVMIVITVAELGTGKPISASVWGHQGSGTSIGGAVSGNQGTTPTPTPTGTPTPTTGSTAPGQTQPTSGASQSPAPSTGAPSTAPSTGATAPASSNPGGAAGQGQGNGGANQVNGATPAP